MTASAYQNERGLLAYDEFDAAWSDGWRLAMRSVDAPPSEMQVLHDLRRLRGVKMFRNGLEIVRARSTNPADRVALMEKLRGFLLTGVALDLTEPEAHRQEDDANSRGNAAQFRRAFFRNRGSRDDVIEAMSAQEIASRLLADTLVNERPALIQVR